MKQVAYNPDFSAARHFKNILSGLGLWEVGTYATGKAGYIDMEDPFDPSSEPIPFINPLTEDHATLRTHLVPSFLGVIRHNMRHGVEPRDIFEIATVFKIGEGEGLGKYVQHRQIGIMSLSKRGRGDKKVEMEEEGYLHVKGLVEKFIGAIGGNVNGFAILEGTEIYPFKVTVEIDGNDWGIIGKVSDQVLDKLDIPYTAHFALLNFDKAREQYELSLKLIRYTTLERFPSVTRDLALVVSEGTLYGDLAECIRKEGGEYLREMKLFDVFRSEKIGAGKKQFAVSLRFNHPDRTLTDEEVDQSVAAIIKATQKNFDAKLRDW
jgi:phenylalanyl-tRNA synthetase beta chain